MLVLYTLAFSHYYTDENCPLSASSVFEFQSLYIELRICIRIRKLDIRNSIEIPDGSAYDLLDLGEIKGTEMENLIAEGWKKARKENVGANLGDFGTVNYHPGGVFRLDRQTTAASTIPVNLSHFSFLRFRNGRKMRNGIAINMDY